jgi:predicted small integral membrane protein
VATRLVLAVKGAPVVFVVRLTKTAMVASTAAFALLVAVDNVVDYPTNYEFVRHVLSMDTTSPGNSLMGHAITNPTLWHVAYWMIIIAEGVIGVALAWAALRLAMNLRAPARRFNAAKDLVVVGAGLGFLLWFLGFMVVGGEWFAMWQSALWNGQQPAFRCYVTLLLVTIVVNQPDLDPDD